MAKIDELLDQINDAKLRNQIAASVAQLRQRKRFGLVYEEHIPEIALCAANVGINPGVEVMLRKDPADRTRYVVESVAGNKATARAGDRVVKVAVRDLLVVKRFGDPVYPVLRQSSAPIVRSGSRAFHTVLNGENFHALQLLLFAYEGQVDCIYIDPPYNTRDRDWKYNNDYVDPADAWHHSKWLSMMERRLVLAKRLLKPDGVLVVLIDEHELHHLGMLLERLFPEYLRYVVSIVINGRGSTGTRNFASIEEQALFVVPNLGHDLIQARESVIPDFHPATSDGPSSAERLLAKIAQAEPKLLSRLSKAGTVDEADAAEWHEATELELDGEDDVLDEDLPEADPDDVPVEDDPAAYWRGAVRTGQGTSFRTQRPNQFYPLFINPKRPDKISVGKPLLERDAKGNLLPPSWKPIKGMVPIWPVDEDGAERVWCFVADRMPKEIAKGNIKIGRFNKKRNTYAVNVRRVRRTQQRFRERTIWWEKSYDSGSNGTNVLKRLLGASGLFDFPKSLYSVRDVLATIVGNRPDALILDFFGGSGTTLHATLLLNAIDDGRRRCILVTNNEVSDTLASELRKAGKFRGDEAFEAMGICRRVTVPRVRAALTGVRPDGATIDGRYKWAAQRPYRDGFEENAVFYDLEYEDPDHIEVGGKFSDILPTLWLAAGAIGNPAKLKKSAHWLLDASVRFGVLLDEDYFQTFVEAIGKRPDLTHIWLVTDSEPAFARMRSRLAEQLHVGMLYKDYLRNFRINVEA